MLIVIIIAIIGVVATVRGSCFRDAATRRPRTRGRRGGGKGKRPKHLFEYGYTTTCTTGSARPRCGRDMPSNVSMTPRHVVDGVRMRTTDVVCAARNGPVSRGTSGGGGEQSFRRVRPAARRVTVPRRRTSRGLHGCIAGDCGARALTRPRSPSERRAGAGVVGAAGARDATRGRRGARPSTATT